MENRETTLLWETADELRARAGALKHEGLLIQARHLSLLSDLFEEDAAMRATHAEAEANGTPV